MNRQNCVSKIGMTDIYQRYRFDDQEELINLGGFSDFSEFNGWSSLIPEMPTNEFPRFAIHGRPVGWPLSAVAFGQVACVKQSMFVMIWNLRTQQHDCRGRRSYRPPVLTAFDVAGSVSCYIGIPEFQTRSPLDTPSAIPVTDSPSNESPTHRNWTWYIFQLIMQLISAFWLRYRVRGLEHIPAAGGGLVLANHQSFLDPLLIGLPLRRPISFLARDSLFRIPFVGWVLRNTYVRPISREKASTAIIRETVQRLEQGYLCGMFPEGTRSATGELGEFKPGFIALLRRTELPVYPVGVAGAHLALGRGSFFLKPFRVCLVFGEPIRPEEIASLKERGREEELVAFVRDRVLGCQLQADAWRISK
jgi:1-acyl-sn-glycerol-3-phosphate acyltransferase